MKDLIPLVKELLKDTEFLAGGVFTHEQKAKQKYNLTDEQIINLQTALYFALNVKNESYNNKIKQLNKY